jgi:predicted nucleotidyltransferase
MALNQTQIEKIIRLAKAYGAKRLILFGSSLGDIPARDIDLACDGVSGWKLYEFGSRLEEELHTPLDIVPLSPSTRFTRLIETKGQVLYEA